MSSDEDSLNNDNYISEEEEVPPPKKKRKPKKDPNKPKRNMSAFFLYSNANRARIKEDTPGIAFGEVVSVKDMLPKFVMCYQLTGFGCEYDLSLCARVEIVVVYYGRYLCEAKVLSKEFKAITVDDRAKWDKLAAEDKERYQREMETYEPPSSDEEQVIRPTIKEDHPTATFGETAKLISKRYKALTEDEKTKFNKLAAEDKERYQKEMRTYKGEDSE
eukprot:scaffold2184_cov266-Chaetoceros_neogracile.AAC.15